MGDPAGSIYVLMASWFTPSSLFIFVNLVIGTIAITSRFGAPRRQTQESELEPGNSPQLVRSPSLLERVRSFNLGLYKHEPTTFAETECVQPQLVRTPPLLERVKSFNFGLYQHQYEPTPAETEHARPDQPEYQNPCLNPDNPPQPQLARAPSLLERLKSVNFSHLYRSNSIHAEKEPEEDDPGSNPGHESGNGRGNVVETSKSESAAGMPEKIRKSASEKSGTKKSEEDGETVERRRPATARSETTSLRGDEEVDARADDFINRFKKQLRLQRIDSILRYREMLKGN